MRLERVSSSEAVTTLNADELRLLNNALNEVCNGVEIAEEEFATRLGATRDEAAALLTRVGEVIAAIEQAAQFGDQLPNDR